MFSTNSAAARCARIWRISPPIDRGPPPITVAQVVAVSEAEYLRWRVDPSAFDTELGQRSDEAMDLKRPG